ncbi:MAG: M23 family metallopeptidase [Leptospirales bacterium]
MKVVLYAVNFKPGEPVYLEIFITDKPENSQFEVKALFYGKKVYLTEHKWGYRGFFGISPTSKEAEGKLTIKWGVGKKTTEKNIGFFISEADFPESNTPLELKKFSNVTKKRSEKTNKFIKLSREKKRKALANTGKNLITNKFSHPRDMHHITSEYWAKRVYSRYYYKKGVKINAKSKTSIHRGLDFRAYEGTPIFVIADGRIVLSDLLFYEGNAVFVDHGNKIFSVYLHMSKRLVKKGDHVKAGSQLGEAGSTGTVTAAHLHLAVYINSVPVNPLSFISLPVRY